MKKKSPRKKITAKTILALRSAECLKALEEAKKRNLSGVVILGINPEGGAYYRSCSLTKMQLGYLTQYLSANVDQQLTENTTDLTLR